jgi:transcriptional regulator with XRE-family HTH domain
MTARLAAMAQTIPARLRKLRTQSGLSLRKLALAMGYADASSIQRYFDEERYAEEALPLAIAKKFAKAMAGLGRPAIREAEVLALAGVTLNESAGAGAKGALIALAPSARERRALAFLGKAVANIRVIGAVQAGSWRTALEWPEEDQYETPVRIDPKFAGLTPIALEVRGPSMNEVFPHGTIVICVAYIELGRGPIHGERVVVQRFRGPEVEASIKEYRHEKDGIPRLWPLSDHPDHQAPLRLDQLEEGEEIVISHKVVRAEIDQP